MAFTKAEILAMSGTVVDEYVLEQVMQFGRATNLGGSGGQVQAPESWIESGPSAPWTRADGSSAPAAPSYIVWVRTVLGSEGLDNLTWMQRITAAMGARGFRLNLFQSAVGGPWTAAYGPAAGGAPATTIQITVPKMEDAVRRAALLAVQ